MTLLALLALLDVAHARPARATTLVLANRSDAALELIGATLEHGRWESQPPERLEPHASIVIVAAESGLVSGVSGEVQYRPVGSPLGEPLVIRWENPFFGHNRYALHGPPELELIQYAGGEGNRTVVQLQVLPPGTPPSCNGEWVMGELRQRRNAELRGFDMAIAAATTPVKEAGISGWVQTGCEARGVGRLVRGPQPSTDGYLTIDVALLSLEAGGAEAPSGRYLRLEVPPGTEASAWAAANPLRRHDVIRFEGPLRVDTDGPWLECHPEPAMERVDAPPQPLIRLRVRPAASSQE